MEIKEAPDYSTVEELTDSWKQIRKELLFFIEALPEETFSQHRDDHWSFSKVCEHLYLSQLPVGIIIKKLLKSPPEHAAAPDYSELKARLLAEKNVKNPDIVSPAHEYSREEIKSHLEKSEAKMLSSLQGLQKADLAARTLEHPLAGKVSLFDWLWIMVLHEKRHLEIMRRRV